MPSFKLTLQSGSGSGTEYPLEKSELFLGRDLSNDIVINDSEVSRRHARLVLSGNTYTIEDLGSTNGTFLRGQRIGVPVALMPGETILIGEKVLLRFDASGLQTDATVASFRTASQPVQPVVQPAALPVQPAAPPVQPAAPVYTPPVQPRPAVQPVAPVAPAPVQYTPPISAYPTAAPKKKKGWLVALLIVVGAILIFCVIPLIIIEVTNSYCALFPGIFNAWQPGACP
jgi:predicted component of type VI protein secretion system